MENKNVRSSDTGFVVQSLSHVWLFTTPWTAACQAPLSSTVSHSLSRFMSRFTCPSGGQSTRSFSFSISHSNEYSELISFRVDWLDLLAVQGTLKSLLQHHNSNTSVLLCSAFFMVQLSHPYVTTRKAVALTIWTFVSKVMSLLFICCLGLS